MATRAYLSGNASGVLVSDTLSGNQLTAALDSVEFYDEQGANFEPSSGVAFYEYQTGFSDEWRSFDVGAVRDYALSSSTPAVVTGKVIRRVRVRLTDFPAGTTYSASFYASLVPADVLSTVLSSNKHPVARLQTDNGSTGFYDNREFRYFREFNIPTGESAWVRITVSEMGIIIRSRTLSLDDGEVKFRIWSDLTLTGVNFVEPSTPAGAADNVSLLCSGHFRQNNLPTAPPYTRLTLIEQGDDHVSATGGVCLDAVTLKTTNATAQRISVGLDSSDERGVSEGVYYLEISNTGNAAAIGHYDMKYEERIGAG